jgi:hypothetical protein
MDLRNVLTSTLCNHPTMEAQQVFDWFYSPCGPWPLFQSPDLFTIGRTSWTSDQLVARPLPKYRTAQTQNKHIYTANIHALSGIRNHHHSVRASEDSSCLRLLVYLDRQASERTKTVHASDGSATVIG